MNKQVVLDVLLKKKTPTKGIKPAKKVYKIISQIYHLNLDQWSLQSNDLNDIGIKEKGQTAAM